MEHLATIQAEFLKEARKWDKMSLEFQKEYLRRHPGSSRRLTARPTSEHTVDHPFVKTLLKQEMQGDGEYNTVNNEITFAQYKKLRRKLIEHYGKPTFYPEPNDYVWITPDNKQITLHKPRSRSSRTWATAQTPEQKALSIADAKLLKNLKTYDFDMSHTNPKLMLKRIIKLYKKYPGQILSVNEGPHGFDEDNLTLVRLPTKEHRQAIERSGEWGPDVTPVDKQFLRDMKYIANRRSDQEVVY